MTNKESGYKYQTDKDISKELFESFNDYLHPLFKSFRADKKTFIIQAVNFVFAFILSYFILGRFLDLSIKGILGSRGVGMKIVLLLTIICIASSFKKNKIMRWQTLFEMSFALTKKYLIRFSMAIAILYGIKNYIAYERGNKG